MLCGLCAVLLLWFALLSVVVFDEEFMRRQKARKQLEVQVEESLKEALAQLHDIEKKDAIEHKEWAREPQGASDPRGQDASARAQRLLEEEQALDYERLRAENVRLQQEREG